MLKIVRSFAYALSGILYTLKTQMNFKIHLAFVCGVCLSGWYFQLSRAEWTGIALSIGFVLVTELINTAIELLVDMIFPEYNSQAGKIKDIAAGAVLLAAVTAVVVGATIFIPKFF